MFGTILAEIIYTGDSRITSSRSFICFNEKTSWQNGKFLGMHWSQDKHKALWWDSLKGREAATGEEASESVRNFLLWAVGFELIAIRLLLFPDHSCERSYSFSRILNTQQCQFSREPCLNLSHIHNPVTALNATQNGFKNYRQRALEW